MGNNTYDIFQESDSIEKINPSSKLSSIDNYYKNEQINNMVIEISLRKQNEKLQSIRKSLNNPLSMKQRPTLNRIVKHPPRIAKNQNILNTVESNKTLEQYKTKCFDSSNEFFNKRKRGNISKESKLNNILKNIESK